MGHKGGEEFAVCLPNITFENAYNICERVREKAEQLTFFTDENVNITVSLGLTATQGESKPINYLLKQGDNAYITQNKVV